MAVGIIVRDECCFLLVHLSTPKLIHAMRITVRSAPKIGDNYLHEVLSTSIPTSIQAPSTGLGDSPLAISSNDVGVGIVWV